MDEKTLDKSPIGIVVKAAAYFLSGLFIITTTIVHVSGTNVTLEIPDSNITMAIGSWLTLFIGSLLTLAGFLYLFTTLVKGLENLLFKYEKWFIAFLFATISTEILKRTLELWNIKPLFFLSVAFAVLLIIVVIVKSMAVFQKVDLLLSMCIAMLAMGIFALFSPNPSNIRWDLLIILIITLGLLFRAVAIYCRKPKDVSGINQNN